MIITIDGPCASGKSTIGRLLAQRLGYYYLYSGLLYRALAYLLATHYNYTADTIAQVTQDHIEAIMDPQFFSYTYDVQAGRETIVFRGTIISAEQLTSPLADTLASVVSTNASVRSAVDAYQRQLAEQRNVIIDGRDAGSVVFKDADFKFFLTAALEVRAQRWAAHQKMQGHIFSEQEACALVAERDKRDANRLIAPLSIPPDAVVVDSSSMTPTQTVISIEKIIKEGKKQRS
jgi:cytidylate kinase